MERNGAPRPRIVSLLASATEIVCALGLRDHLVGISHECDYPPEALDRPRVSRPRFDPAGLRSREIDRAVREALAEHGSVYVVDAERLGALRPDLVLTQAVCEVCAVPTASTEAAVATLPDPPRVVSLDAHDLEGIFRTVLELGEAAGARERAEAYVAGLRARVEAVRHRVEGLPRPRVLALEWLDPPFVPGHWVPEMVEIAGGTILYGEPGRRSHEVSWDDLEGRDPDALVVMPCGLGLEASRAEAYAGADRLRSVARRAIESGRAFVVDASSFFNRSGPRVVDGIEILAALLHPGAIPDVALAGRASRWP
jgi:iron complex transport system substrate-binding protein